MVLDWLDVGGRWLGPPRGGGKGNREAQRKREAEKRKIARAKARAARDAAGEVVNKRGEDLPSRLKNGASWGSRSRVAGMRALSSGRWMLPSMAE